MTDDYPRGKTASPFGGGLRPIGPMFGKLAHELIAKRLKQSLNLKRPPKLEPQR